jgi:hypothetical protein
MKKNLTMGDNDDYPQHRKNKDRIVVNVPVSNLLRFIRLRKIRKRQQQKEIDEKLHDYFESIDERGSKPKDP